MEDFKEYLKQAGAAPFPKPEQMDAVLNTYPWFMTGRIVRSLTWKALDVDMTDQLLTLHLSASPMYLAGLLAFGQGEFYEGALPQHEPQAELEAAPVEAELPAHEPEPTQDSIIDAFLAHGEYRIVPAEGDGADGPARQDAAPEPDAIPEIVTEELAEIYMRQQLWPQAKAAYEKLSLLYPKKSVYFAEIIARIVERQN
jgi:hypothetical protein